LLFEAGTELIVSETFQLQGFNSIIDSLREVIDVLDFEPPVRKTVTFWYRVFTHEP
jgi:hypothetical protein